MVTGNMQASELVNPSLANIVIFSSVVGMDIEFSISPLIVIVRTEPSPSMVVLGTRLDPCIGFIALNVILEGFSLSMAVSMTLMLTENRPSWGMTVTADSDIGQLLITGACPEPEPNPDDEFIGMRVSFVIGMMGFPPLPEPELIILPYTIVLVLAT